VVINKHDPGGASQSKTKGLTYHNYVVPDLIVSSLIFRVVENSGIGRELDDDACCFGAGCEGKRDRFGIKP